VRDDWSSWWLVGGFGGDRRKPVAAILEATMNRSGQIVRSGVAATMILALGYFFVPEGWGGMFTFFKRAVAPIVGWAGTIVTVPVWWLVLVSGLMVMILGTAAYIASTRSRKHASATARLTKADIFGIRWRWQYEDGDVRNLASFCPKCDRPVHPKTETRHGFLRLISYQCECRHWQSKSFQCSQTEIIDRVCRTIQKQART
jgi:hypothetical protein